MTRFLMLLAINISLATPWCAKGRGGTYILAGVAFSQSGDTLKNQSFLMYFNDRVDTIHTDSKGWYQTKICWATACPSGHLHWQTRRATRKMNPEDIYFSYEGNTIKIKNEWKKFLKAEWMEHQNNTELANLFFRHKNKRSRI
jgi:hypothetical protein